MLKDTATLGIRLSVHIYGEPEVVDHSNVLATSFPQLCFRDFTLGRDLGGILSMSEVRGKHLPEFEGPSPDTVVSDSSRIGGTAGASSTCTQSGMLASNVPLNLVLHEKTFSDIKLVAESCDERTEIFAQS